MIDRAELDQWLREHDYMLATREQVARTERMVEVGAVPWDVHRRALAKADAELAELRPRVAQLEAAGRALLDTPLHVTAWPALNAFRAVLDGNATPTDREEPTDA